MMNVDLWLAELQKKVTAAVQSLTPDDVYNVWLASGVLLFIFLAWLCHRIMRKALGHILFRGTWYNEQQHEALIKMIDEDNTKGNRVMKHDEMSLLRRWRLGDTRTYGVKQSGYF